MTQQPPSSQTPQRGKEPWRLRGVKRAQPHLGEDDPSPWTIWAIGGGVIVVLLVIVAFVFLKPGTPAPVRSTNPTPTLLPAASLPTETFAVPTPTALRLPSPTLIPLPTSTPTPVPPTATATRRPTRTPTAFRYQVQFGDTLSSISFKYHISIEAIRKANNLKSDIIRAGDELIIPLPTPTRP